MKPLDPPTPTRLPGGRWRALRAADRIAWAAAVGFVFIVIAPWTRSVNPHDYYQFWCAGQALRTLPIHDLYSEADGRLAADEFRLRAKSSPSPRFRAWAAKFGRLAFTGSPLLVTVLAAGESGDFDVDARRFRIASALVFGAGFLTLAWALGFPGLWALTLLGAFTLGSWPFYIYVSVLNITAFQTGGLLFAVALLKSDRPRGRVLCGALLGFLTLLKPTIAPVTILLMTALAVDRRWTDMIEIGAGGAAAGLIGLLAPRLVYGSACTWSAWRASLPAVLFTDWWLTGGFLAKLTGIKSPGLTTLFLVVLLGSAGVFFMRTRRPPDVVPGGTWTRYAAAAALGALVSLVASPIVHSHYFLMAIPAALIVLRPGRPRRFSLGRHSLGIIAIILLGAHPLFRAAGLTPWANHSLWTFAGVWLLAGLLLQQRLGSGAPLGLGS